MTDWLSGLLVGIVTGMALLIGGMIGGVLALGAAVPVVRGRALPYGAGLVTGWGVGWMVLVGRTVLACTDCDDPPTALMGASLAIAAIGCGSTLLASRVQTEGRPLAWLPIGAATWIGVTLAIQPSLETVLLLLVAMIALPFCVDRVFDGKPIAALVGPASIALAVAMVQRPSDGALLIAAPWICTAALLGGLGLVDGLRRLPTAIRGRSPTLLLEPASLGFVAIGALFLVADRLGVRAFGFDELSVRLAATHFTVAGGVLPAALAGAALRRPGGNAQLAAVLVLVGIPATGIGSLIGLNHAFALALAAAGFLTAWLHLRVAPVLEAVPRSLVAISGLSLMAGVALATGWAVTGLLRLPYLTVSQMLLVHGTLNAAGFSIPASLGWWLAQRPSGVDHGWRRLSLAVDRYVKRFFDGAYILRAAGLGSSDVVSRRERATPWRHVGHEARSTRAAGRCRIAPQCL